MSSFVSHAMMFGILPWRLSYLMSHEFGVKLTPTSPFVTFDQKNLTPPVQSDVINVL